MELIIWTYKETSISFYCHCGSEVMLQNQHGVHIKYYTIYTLIEEFALERSIFLVLMNTTTGYQIFVASIGATMFIDVSSLRFRNVNRGSIQLIESLNLTLNSSATSEIDKTAQIS